MSEKPSTEAVVSVGPGEAVSLLVVAVAIERGRGVISTPRITATGTRVTLPARKLAGSGEVVVTVRGNETVVRLEGDPPPWPWSVSWERRTLRRLLGRTLVRWASPSSGD